ncbi:MAG: NAD(P)-dependent oxidoreductase [bacterium]|nr:NAD(P)-dependent oxidoreductase [bacterium]
MSEIKRVAVTGANGYIGYHVVQELLSQNYEVIAVDLTNDSIDPRAIFKAIDIFSELNSASNEKSIYEELGKPDLCIHLAWQDGFKHDSHRHMENLSNHYRFLLQMIEAGCSNIAVMGSMHEVGYWEGKIDENTPCNPLSQYGIAKNALRQSMIQLSKSLPFQLYWLRAYYILGDDAKNHSIFAKLVQAEAEGKTSFPFTTGKNQYDFIDIHELAIQIVAAVTQSKITGIINVCSGQPVSLATRVEQFIKDHHFKIQLDYGRFPDRPYDSPITYGDAEKIQSILLTANTKGGL